MLTEEQIRKAEDLGAKRWMKKDMDRLYINVKALGYEWTYHKIGSLDYSYFRGEMISNYSMYRILDYKSYIDVKTGEVVCDRRSKYEYYNDAVQEFAKKVLSA